MRSVPLVGTVQRLRAGIRFFLLQSQLRCVEDTDTRTLHFEIEGDNAKEVVQAIFQTVSAKDVCRASIEVEARQGFVLDASDIVRNVGETADFRLGSKSAAIAALMYEVRDEGWVCLEEAREICPLPRGVKFPKDKASGIMWDLAERGIIEKKSHPEDGRRNVYRLSDFGEKSIDHWLSRESVEPRDVIEQVAATPSD